MTVLENLTKKETERIMPLLKALEKKDKTFKFDTDKVFQKNQDTIYNIIIASKSERQAKARGMWIKERVYKREFIGRTLSFSVREAQ